MKGTHGLRIPHPRQALDSRTAEVRILVGKPRLKNGRTRRVRDTGQRFERRLGALSLSVVAQLLGERLNRSLVPNLAERADRRVADLGVGIVDRFQQAVAGRHHVQAADDAGGPGTDGRIVMVERLDQPGDRRFGQRHARRRPDHAEGVDRLEADVLVLVVDGLQQRVDELGRHGLGPDSERAPFERGRRTPIRPNLDHEGHALLRRDRLDQKERQLRVDGLELDRVHRVVDHRRERGDRFRVSSLAQQTHGAHPDLRVGIAEVPDDVLELGRLLGHCRNRCSHDERGNNDHQPYKSGHGRSSGGLVIVTEQRGPRHDERPGPGQYRADTAA